MRLAPGFRPQMLDKSPLCAHFAPRPVPKENSVILCKFCAMPDYVKRWSVVGLCLRLSDIPADVAVRIVLLYKTVPFLWSSCDGELFQSFCSTNIDTSEMLFVLAYVLVLCRQCQLLEAGIL